MSPEQATGDAHVGPATDIYALGCVLYEMLVGEPPYTGSTPQAILGKIITEPPAAITKARKSAPPHVEATIVKALEKVPADRFRTGAEVSKALSGDLKVRDFRSGGRALTRATNRLCVIIPWGVAALAVGLLFFRDTPEAGRAPRSWDVVLPDSAPMAFLGSAALGVGLPAVALSPDGSHLVYAAQVGTTTQLFVRPTDGSALRALPGTEGAYHPFFSRTERRSPLLPMTS
jgi:hypothetical protein